MGRRSAGRSFFSNIPADLRRSIRSQPLLPPEDSAGSTLPDVELLLPTQPASISDLDETVAESSKRKVSPSEPGRKRKRSHPYRWDCSGLVPRYGSVAEVPAELRKYWYQREFLLPGYDKLPLLLDNVGWYSITPHPIAAHIAERCRCDVIVDAFCGVGGNAIAFARTCERVIAIDNDETRLRLARHNAVHLGVADRIEFILADFTQVARRLHPELIDVVFLSPPWGGPEYLTSESYSLDAIQPIPGDGLFALASTLTPNVAYYLPRNIDVEEVSHLAIETDGDREWVEIEEEWVGDKVKAVTAYFGSLVADS